MLQAIEIVPRARKLVRRGIELGCELTTNVHGPRRERLVDLSPRGARILTDMPLRGGETVLVAFASEWLARRVETLARVVHVDRPAFSAPSIGVEFTGLDSEVRFDLARRLRNVPPPIPKRRAATSRELLWVDMVVSWDEDLGDRVNTFSFDASGLAEVDEDFELLALAEPLA
jgi:hypothetical protein